MVAGGLTLAISVLLLFCAGQAVFVAADFWIKVWVTASDNEQSNTYYLKVYIALCFVTAALAVLRAILFFTASIRANTQLHDGALARVLDAPMMWFSANPLGRILNRFSADVGQIDELLPVSLFETLQLAGMVAGSLVVVCIAIPWFLFALPVLFYSLWRLRKYATRSLRELKRLDGTTRSPFFDMFSATLNGIVSIRAFGRQTAMQAAFLSLLEVNARTWFWWLIGNRWLGFRLDILSSVVVALAVVFGIGLREQINPGYLGLALVYAISLSGLFQYMVRQSALVETYMTSVERLLHYGRKLPSEHQADDADVGCPPAIRVVPSPHWPDKGTIELQSVCVRYRADLAVVLQAVSALIPGGAKIGIIGRTGSGKSSLIQALFRLNEICEGRILIDGVDIAQLDVTVLRSQLSLIPQEPALFSGTVRYNLDPFGQYSDGQIVAVLQQVHLEGCDLDSVVKERGENLSVGQRQLISLARAMLRNRRIVIADEATSNIDYAADSIIQKTLREADCFRSATLLVIAHRIKTIADSDLILVLDNGRVLEMGTPAALLADPSSAYSAMVHEAALSSQSRACLPT